MGSWGIDPFSNDNAMDFVDELRLIDSPSLAFDRVREALRAALKDPDLVEVDVAEAAIAAAALVALNVQENGNSDTKDHRGWEFIELSDAEEIREISLLH
ncbi:DUF4259 domain-containing protein [Kitasatospora sp. NPDC059327]|uniref:DUF4259 domain-containing protein n=1 Tax=Kitasatospora sp. NPDC059327 TaxID=3346803 RepID=UPI00367466BF